MSELILSALAGLIALATIYFIVSATLSQPRSYPPGPDVYPIRIPLFGLISKERIPTSYPWLGYTEWAQRFGPLMHTEAFNKHLVIANSLNIARELLEKRPHIYSSRPRMPMFELTGHSFGIALQPYNEKYRWYRRVFDKHFRPDSSKGYRPIVADKIRDFLCRLSQDPSNIMQHTRALPAAIVMSVVYGYEVVDFANDRFIYVAERFNAATSDTLIPGTMLVNTFPVLKHLPGWMPGCGFQRFAAEMRGIVKEMLYKPFEYVVAHKYSRDDPPPVLAAMLAEAEEPGEMELKMMREVAGIAYGAAADTTVSTLMTFFLAMTLQPEVQLKAQTELDSVLATTSEPTNLSALYEHKTSLPYIEAIYREVLRWRPALPLLVPRTTTADDVYDGYSIPKGATVIPNIWAMNRDESIFGPNPESFNPERFLNSDGSLRDAHHAPLAFGFGPRICAGRFFAEDIVWLTIASVLFLYNITKSKEINEDGVEIEVNVDPTAPYSDAAISHPLPFKCSITPRSSATESFLVRLANE